MPFSCMKRVDQALLHSLVQQAADSPRLRAAHPVHAPAERVQRVLIALQPGPYVASASASADARHPQV